MQWVYEENTNVNWTVDIPDDKLQILAQYTWKVQSRFEVFYIRVNGDSVEGLKNVNNL